MSKVMGQQICLQLLLVQRGIHSQFWNYEPVQDVLL